MGRWEQLISCIQSGQLTPAQVAEELKDPHFAAYYRQRTARFVLLPFSKGRVPDA